MQQLHAYWRMAYIEAPRYPARMKRPFTELPALGDDRAALIVHRSKLAYLILNRFPYNPGHLLAIPFREVADIDELTAAESAALMDEVIFAKRLLGSALKPDGFNVGFNEGAAAGHRRHRPTRGDSSPARVRGQRHGRCAVARRLPHRSAVADEQAGHRLMPLASAQMIR